MRIGGSVGLSEDQGTVCSAEAERIGQRNRYVTLQGHVRRVEEIALGILVLQVDGRRHDPLLDCHHRKQRFYGAGGAQRMPVVDFVELMTNDFACSPNVRLTASVSATSPRGVDVPWALT